MTLYKIKVFLISKTYAESISHAFSRKEKHKEIFINFDNISMISGGIDDWYGDPEFGRIYFSYRVITMNNGDIIFVEKTKELLSIIDKLLLN